MSAPVSGHTASDSAHEAELLRNLSDAMRYRRLRILGCAPGGSSHLHRAHVLRFTNLDEYVDADIKAHPSRGEAQSDDERSQS